MIECRDLTILYKSGKGIFDINLSIPDGGCVTLVGPSGSGKSTLLHGIAGWLQPHSGEVLPNVDNPALGIVPQEDALYPWLTAAGNAALGLKGRVREHRDRLEELFLSLELETETLDRLPGNLSGGQRRRVALARTLINNPDILLLDEPSSSLDTFTKESLQDLLLTMHIKKARTTILVTHSIEEAIFLGESIIVMNEGRIKKIFSNPLFPDPEARTHKQFYELLLNIRSYLKEGVG